MTDEVVDRLLKSQRIYLTWREMPPSGAVEETLRMIREEITWLEKLAVNHPDSADKIDRTIARWKEMAARYRERAN